MARCTPYGAAMAVLVTGAAGFIGVVDMRARLLERGERSSASTISTIITTRAEAGAARRAARSSTATASASNASTSPMRKRSRASTDSDGIRPHRPPRRAGRRPLQHRKPAGLRAVEPRRSLQHARARAGTAVSRHMVYASSSSVYGGNKNLPFRVEDRVDHPLSLYAATKKADELLSESYASTLPPAADRPALLHRLRAVGPARHGDVDLHQGALRGRAAAAVQPRRDAPRLHLHRRHRPRRRRLPRRPAGRRRRGEGRRKHQRRTRSTISATAAARI